MIGKKSMMAALLCTASMISAQAANPFADVSSDSWAYRSVTELARSGIIQGVDSSRFEGTRLITRYEAAEMTARAMAHMDKASVEQRAMVSKLADEYQEELNSLGVRITVLERKTGNIKLTGDARIRYRYQKNNLVRENDNAWDYRIRVQARGQVNERTEVTLNISSNNKNFGSNTTAASESVSPQTDIMNVRYCFGPSSPWILNIGRTDLYVLGNGFGYQYGDAFDRAELKYETPSLRWTVGYGKFKGNGAPRIYEGKSYDFGMNALRTAYTELEYFTPGGSALGVYYNNFNGAPNGYDRNKDKEAVLSGAADSPDSLWGTYAKIYLGKHWNLQAEYQHVKQDDRNHLNRNDANIWTGVLQYGQANFGHIHSWDAWIEYIDAEKGGYYGDAFRWRNYSNDLLDGVRSWGVGIDYIVAKNTMFGLMHSFHTKGRDGNPDPEEAFRMHLIMLF